MTRKPHALVLCGPTASGKTAFSLRYALEYGCEIVCMDSMQIYRGMDIGTAKASPEERALVPHHLLDVADPGEAFSVAQYQELAEAAIAEITARGKTALLVGGTGFYLRALRHDMAMGGTPANPAIRSALEEQAAQPGGKEALHRLLAQADPLTAARLHPNDTRRVIRALEVFQATGRPFSAQEQSGQEPPFDYRVAALTMDRAILYERIDRRVDEMIAQGLPGEVQHLLQAGIAPDSQAMKAIGYKEFLPYLAGSCTLEEAAQALKQASRHYAKRQFTWFRREENVTWVDALAPDAYAQLQRVWQDGGESDEQH